VNVRGRWRAVWTGLPLVAVLVTAAFPLVFLTNGFVKRPAFDVSSLWPALMFALSGAAVSALIGGVLGALVGTLQVSGRRTAIAVAAALIAAPPAFWWIGLTHLSTGVGHVSGPTAASVVAGAVLAPITMLLVLAATREIAANTYEAARLSLGPARRIAFVLAPLVGPAVIAGFLLTAIILLGESEIPFLFGFRTSMTDVVTTFSQTFDARRTVPVIVPLVAAVLAIALLMVRPLFMVILPGATGGRGIVRKPARRSVSVATFVLPAVVGLSLAGYARAALSGAGIVWSRLSVSTTTVVTSIAEPVLCAFAAVAVGVLAAYPPRRSSIIRPFAVVGLLLFCVPTAVIAIGWIAVEQALGGISVGPGVVHVSRMLGLAVLGFLIAYARVPRSLEDAAQLVPVSPVRRAWGLIVPLVGPTLAATAALIAALIFADRDVASLRLAAGDSRLMLNLYLRSANAPSAVVGGSALIVFVAGAIAVALAAAGPTILWMRRRG
jgi:iron(III) transport system permease protein